MKELSEGLQVLLGFIIGVVLVRFEKMSDQMLVLVFLLPVIFLGWQTWVIWRLTHCVKKLQELLK